MKTTGRSPWSAYLLTIPSVTAINGFAPEEMLGQIAVDLIHPDNVLAAREMDGRILANPGQPFPVRLRRRPKNGNWIWLEGVATHLLDDPAVRAIVTNYRDITARRQVEEERERLAQLIEHDHDFIAIADLDGRITFMNRGETPAPRDVPRRRYFHGERGGEG